MSVRCFLVIQFLLAGCFLSDASLFQDECSRNGFQSAYDATTDTCWIVEKTTMIYSMAATSCNHMPGYSGHLGFPKTAAQQNFLYTQFASNTWYGFTGLHHIPGGLNWANKSEWFWTYPNGSMENGTGALWYGTFPWGFHECSYVSGVAPAIVGMGCATPYGLYCQYDRSTAHHETMLEHKCKQFTNWFWWEPTKSCILLDTFLRMPAYSKLMCTQIPGYRGHLAHVTSVEKFASLDSFRDLVQNNLMWIGLERDPNMSTYTNNAKDGFYWRRDDGYKIGLGQQTFAPGQRLFDNYNSLYTTLQNTYFQDDLSTLSYMTLCEYEENLRYAPTPLDIQCANLSLPHVYYKGSCYVRQEATATYYVAKASCNHIDGFNGHLAVLRNAEILNIIYYALTLPTGGYNYYWLGLERLNTSGANTSSGYYWLTGNGQSYPLTDFSAAYPGYPTGATCGYGYLGYFATAVCTFSFPFVCEYVEPSKGTHFRVQANFANKKAIPQAILKIYDDLTMQEMCGYQCTKEPLCNSIAFNVNTLNCLLQSIDSSSASSNEVFASGYQWYDRY